MKSNNKLIDELKKLAKMELEKNERFHDWGHAISAYNNAKKIIAGEKAGKKVNVVNVLTATLFHDISNVEKNDSQESARLVLDLLNKVPDFPKDQIKEVQRLITSIDKGMMNEDNLDEVIVNEADSLEALSKLSICRGLMLCAKRGWSLKYTLDDFKKYIDKKYGQLTGPNATKTTKKIAKQQMPFIKKFLSDCIKIYE